MSARAPALAACLLLGAALAGRAQDIGQPLPAAPAAGAAASLVEAVEVGFDGAVGPWRIPASLWVTLHNKGDRELDLTVVMKSKLGATERQVQLPSGARKRVSLALAVEGQLLLELRDGAKVLEDRTLSFEIREAERHLLVLDGRPPDRRAGKQKEHDDAVLRFTTIDAASAPTEAACYAAVAAVMLREVDPGAWVVDQREALLEYVREGGLVLLAAATPQAQGMTQLFEGLPAGPQELQKVAGRAARLRRLGLGSVLAFSDDPLALSMVGPQGADLKQRLGDLVEEARKQRRYPRPFDERENVYAEAHPGLGTQLLVAGFLLVYFLAVGPALAVILRRARRRSVALATLVLVGGFTLLAPMIAGVVRTGRGQVRHRVVVWVPPQGVALELGDAQVLSGGATRYDVEVDGQGGEVAATLLESMAAAEGNYRTAQGHVWLGARPAAVRTARGERSRLEARMPPWGAQRIFTQALRPDVRRVQTSLSRALQGAVVSIVNDSGADLHDAVIVEEALDGQGGGVPGYVRVGTLRDGDRREVLLPRQLEVRMPYLPEVMDLPWQWTAWRSFGAPPGQQHRQDTTRSPRYRLVSRIRPRVRIGGPNLSEVVHALRLDPIEAAPAAARGYLGVGLEQVEELLSCVRCDKPLAPTRDCPSCRARAQTQRRVKLTPMAGGPCARAGVQAGDVLVKLDGQRVTSIEQLRGLVQRRAPGDTVTLVVRDELGAVREHKVVLARAPGSE